MSSYTSQKIVLKRKQRREQQKMTNIRTSYDSHLYWKSYFQKNLLFRIIADFGAEIDNSNIGNQNTKVLEHSSILSDNYRTFEFDDVLKSA